MLPYLIRRISRRPRDLLMLGSLLALLLMFSGGAQAIPAYARQTGSACADCHAGAYGYSSGGGNGPNLTPYGMQFKMNGYTDTDGQGFKLPLSAQLVASHNAPAQGKGHSALAEADLYIAGRVSDNVGGFVKVENDKQGEGSHYQSKLSELDLRYVAKNLKLAGREFLLGATVNNSPGLTDPIADLPGAIYLSPGGATGGTLLNPLASPNSLAGHVIGASVYGLYDKHWYGELGTYRDLPLSLQDRVGYRRTTDPGRLSDTAYGRFAYMLNWKRQFFSAGLVGLTTRRQLPETAPTDKITDLGYDASYQYLGNRENIIQVSYVNIMERRHYGSTFFANGFESLGRGVVHDETFSATYAFHQQFGLQFAHLVSTGTNDVARFGLTGPDTTANSYTLFWTPFGRDESLTSLANLKLALTWFRFTKVNGATDDIFGFLPPGAPGPRKPSDLNSLTASASLAF